MNTKTILSILFVSVLISACGGNTAAPPAPEPVVVEAQPVIEEAAAVEMLVEPVAEAPQPEAPQPDPPAASSGMMPYSSPEGLFTLEVPSGWSSESNTDLIDDTVVETHTAPDGHAFVQVVVSEAGTDVDNVEKGQITLDFMKRLYGSDLRVASDVTLPDERERLVWWSDDNETSGTTFFDTAKTFLYFYTTYYEDDFEKDYESILEDVNDSYIKD